MRRHAFLFAIVFATALQAAPPDIEKLIREMTLEEKLGQLSQYVPDQPELQPALKNGHVGSILNGGGAERVNELQRAVLAGSRLKIPMLVGHDVIHGYRTIFPIPLGIAATWDPSLAELSASVAAREARAAGIRWTFAPMVDIARDPRWGRISEGAGEDPHLGKLMAAAYVRGFQNNGLLACAKHYAAYGGVEGGRDYGTVEMSEQTLRDVYLPPFRAAAEAGAATFMSAFNTVNGVPATSNRFLLTDVLRGEWGFRGFVVSDWSSVTELIHHRVAAAPRDAAVAAINAGVDMAMVDGSYMTLGDAVRDKRVSMATIDEAVRRVLRAKVAAGLFDDPFTDASRTAATMLTRENRDAARRVARQSFVLLRNEGDVLPLRRDAGTIAVVGPLAESRVDLLGSWAAEGKAEDAISIFEGLRAAAGTAKVMLANDAEAAGRADVIVAVLGENRDMSGEAASRASIELSQSQQRLLEELVSTGKPVVLLVLSGRPLALAWAAEHVPAILQVWFPGIEGAAALAEVVFGDAAPGGRLPVTIPRATGQVPIYYAQLPSGRPADPANKFTNKYIDVPIGPLYPFGHGLTYTKFEYSDVEINGNVASIAVRNAGSRDGEEVVQLYITDVVASVSRPVRELKDYRRIALKAGETQRVEFTITREQLSFWKGKILTAEPGQFRLRIGPNSAVGLETTYELK
ncbi:MAG TPA: glycoside hydrolase family 3 N-terminal domain-containing protein [Thermoanaerobaculia bacterium]|nr:glycoside hydrolase family 3 N-terminal domain-containing protein [Thermoanaerobaculia bacterium]